MHKKSFTFGVGVGIMVIAAALMLVYNIQRTSTRGAHENDLAMFQIEINDLTADVQRLTELNNELAGAQNYQPLDDVDVVAAARELGMVFPEEAEPPTPPTPPTDDPTSPTEITPIPTPNPPPPPPTPESSGTYMHLADGRVQVTIPNNMDANGISNLLYRSGVISNRGEFLRVAGDGGHTRSLMSGSFIFDRVTDGDYSHLVESLSVR